MLMIVVLLLGSAGQITVSRHVQSSTLVGNHCTPASQAAALHVIFCECIPDRVHKPEFTAPHIIRIKYVSLEKGNFVLAYEYTHTHHWIIGRPSPEAMIAMLQQKP